MKKIILFAAWVGGILTHWLVGTPQHTRWLNEETSRQDQWGTRQHTNRYGAMSSMVIRGNYYHTNLVVEVGTGTNRHPIEFGFREDGTVVWRKR